MKEKLFTPQPLSKIFMNNFGMFFILVLVNIYVEQPGIVTSSKELPKKHTFVAVIFLLRFFLVAPSVWQKFT